jgi:PAS domain S-box-containing protein
MHSTSSEQRYQILANQALEHAMIVMDRDGVIVEWSAGAEKLLGWRADEAVGKPVAVIFTQEDRAAGAAGAELHTALALGRCADTRWHQRKDGGLVFCDGIVNKLVDEDSKRVLGFGKILREAYVPQHAAADGAKLAGAEQRSFLAAVLESVENGIVACDRQGRLTFFNDAARHIHGLEEQPISFEDWAGHYQLYHADGRALLTLDEVPLYRALRGERVQQARIVVQAADGRRRHVEVSGRSLLDGAGQILGAVISMHDVSALHDVQDARDATLREQDKRFMAEEAQDRLRLTEQQLRLATQAARLGIGTWDMRQDRGTWENEEMYEIFNVPFGEPIVDAATLIADYLHPDDVGAFRRAVEQTARHGERFYFSGRFYRLPERELHWVELTGVLQAGAGADTDAAARILIGTAADVTQRKRIEESLEEARLRLAATLAAGEVATWIWDIDNDRIIGDRNLARLFGLPGDVAAGTPLSTYMDAIHRDDVHRVTQQIRHAVDSREPYRADYRIVHPDGGYRWVSARGRLEVDDSGRPEFLAGVILDITRQKQAQEALRITEERYRTLIGSMDEAFAIVQVLVDADGRPVDYRFEEVNHAFELQSGLAEAAAKTIREMVPDIEPHWIEIYGRVALSREPARFIEHSEAMGYWWDMYATPIGEPEERRIAILFSDITARRESEENLRLLAADLSESNRRKTEFLATLAHELRNPLSPMRTGLDLMRMTAGKAQSDTKMLDMMDRQLTQMVHLIDDLMDVSRINSGKIVLKKSRIDLKVAIANAVETALPAVQAARHRLHANVPEQPLMVDADPIRLAQIFGNLLTNAVKYTPHGGNIVLSARQRDGDIVFAVTDTGIGIPVEEQARVFEMFSQVSANMGRAQGGLGIGLSLVRSLVEMHGGSVKVSSSGAVQGSTFTVTLPAADSQEPGAVQGEAAAAAPAATRALRIVLADDNTDAADMLGSLLEATGHAIDIVHDGATALRKIMESHPEMAILDIGMPGMNGYEVARAVRDTPAMQHTVLVALTGWGGELDRERSHQAGFDAHLTKPASVDEINRLIATVTRRP